MRYLKQANSQTHKVGRGYQGPERGGNSELLFNGHRVPIWDDEKVLEIESGDVYTML